MKFDKRQTNIAKGVALLLLLWHHLFYKHTSYFSLFDSAWLIDGIPVESCIAAYGKVCVAIFLFLSGYGMFKSGQSLQRRTLAAGKTLHVSDHVRYVKNHLIRLMADYWLIYLIFVPLGICFGVYFWEVYQENFGNGVLDFFALSFYFRTPSMNPSWWYMSIILAFYLLFPLLKKWADVLPELMLAVALGIMLWPEQWRHTEEFEKVSGYIEWLPPLLLGMLMARCNGFERIARRYPHWWQGALFAVPAVALTAYQRFMTSQDVRFDALFALAIILLCYLFLSHIPVLSSGLAWLGGYSGTVYMLHTFVFLLYGKEWVYSLRFPPLIFTVVLAVCLLLAVGIKYFKKLLRIDKLIAKITCQ